MERELLLNLPLRLKASKKGKLYSLNLNIYRNLHFQVLNNLKHNFAENVREQLKDKKAAGMFKKPFIRYVLYSDNNRTTDLMNWISVIDKFVMDALVEQHVLIDDSTEFIKELHVRYGGVQKGRGRVEMEITEGE